ncbi:MAG: outer membrane beta-barrel protein [Pseudomonadota bacterium]
MRLLATMVVGAALLAAPQDSAKAGGDFHEGGCGHGHWSAMYVGGSLGYGRLSSDQTSPTDPNFRVSDDDSGFTGGGYVGKTWQCDRFVFGIEGDINFAGMETSGTQSANYGGGAASVTLGSDMSWWGTLRARLGMAHDDYLFYATGGLAFASVENDFRFTATGCGGGVCIAEDSSKDTRLGWTVGAGVERMHDRFLLRIEGLYVNLRDEERVYRFDPAYCVACEGRVDYEDDFFVVRAGLSIKLGHREEYVPLK